MEEEEMDRQELRDNIIKYVDRFKTPDQVEKLKEHIRNRIVTLLELQKTNKLTAAIRRELEPIWEEVQEENSLWKKVEEGESIAKCEEYLERYSDGYYRQKVLVRMEDLFWTIAKGKNNITAYKSYIDKCQEEKYKLKGRYIDEANELIEKIQIENDINKEKLLDDILNNTTKYPPEELQKLFEKEKISKKDLYDREVTKNALDTYLNPPKFEHSTGQKWSDLPPLPKGNTDIYLFGNYASGKTCILAGLFAHGRDSDGKLDINSEQINNKGVKFANELISKSIKTGYTPPATPTGVANFVPGRIRYANNNYNISFIEMSGEHFIKSYDGESIKGQNSIGANAYLANDNNKSILLVIDYDSARGDADHANLQSIFLYVLNALNKDGTLKSTDALQIVVTKADLIESNRAEEVNKYINEHYSALIAKIQQLNRRYNINPTADNKVLIHPFSLGKFMLQRTFEFDDADSKKLLDFIAILSRPNKKKIF